MTLEEANLVGRIVATADAGCSCCVGSLVDMLNEAFPQFEWTYDDSDWSMGNEDKVTVKERTAA